MRPIADTLYEFSWSKSERDLGSASYIRWSPKRTVRKLGESWFQKAIVANPELVIGPCRNAGLTDGEAWYFWQREFVTGAGKIDVLLLSSEGRIGVVETKLASNRESRRKVLAQALDYLSSLDVEFESGLPPIPVDEAGEPVADGDDIKESARLGNVLVIIASDDIDPRVARLSQTLLADHQAMRWDLALIDVAIFESTDPASDHFFVVPTIRNVIKSEPRLIVHVEWAPGTTPPRVELQAVTSGESESVPERQKWDQKQYFEHLPQWGAPKETQTVATKLVDLAEEFPESVSLAWGTGRKGCLILKKNGAGLIELRGSGSARFRLDKITEALGEKGSSRYIAELKRLFPGEIQGTYPRIASGRVGPRAEELYASIREAIVGREDRSE